MTQITLSTRHKIRDGKSARSYDDNGFLHVSDTPITKEQIVGYMGHELPGENLQPDKEYKLYRPMEELRKGAASFNGLPIMDEHHTATADNPKPFFKVGSMMNNVHDDGTYLIGDAVIHDGDAIKKINDGSQRQLSAEYKCDTDMTPGTFNGQKYDGVIRDIKGNHVALVPEGRAGPDVTIKDHKMADDKDPKAGMPKVFADMVYGLQQFCGDQSQDWCRETISKAIAEGNSKNKNVTQSDAKPKKEGKDVSDKKTKDAEPVETEKKDDPQEDKPEDVQDAKTGEGIEDFIKDKDEQMKKDGYDDKTRKMCLNMCREAAKKSSGDDSKVGDAKCHDAEDKEAKDRDKTTKEDCSKKMSDSALSDSAINEKINQAILSDRKRHAQLSDAKEATKHVLGNTTLSDANEIYRAALVENGCDEKTVASISDTNALKAMFKMSDRKPSLSNNVLFSDSAPGGDDPLSAIKDILPE